MGDATARFLRDYGAAAVGATPPQPGLPVPEDGEESGTTIDRGIEVAEDRWDGKTVSEAPARPGEFPVRFVDGSHVSQPVLYLESKPDRFPIPILLGELGAVALRTDGRRFTREFAVVERIVSFVVDPFPWEHVEAFAEDILNKNELKLRLLPANRPDGKYNPFDYEQKVEVKRSDIKDNRLSDVSPMPAGMINRLNPEELKDLLAYLLGK